MIIKLDEVYNYSAKTRVEVACSRCGIICSKVVNSIRVNMRSNKGEYVCQKCKTKNPDYLAKQHKSHPKTGSKWNTKIDVKCSECGKLYRVVYRSAQSAKRNGKQHTCMACVNIKTHAIGKYDHIYTNEFKEQLLENGRKFWDEHRDTWRQEMSSMFDDPEYCKLMSECGRKPWRNPELRKKMLESMNINGVALWQDNEYRAEMLARMHTDEYREHMRETSKKIWEDPELRAKMLAKLDDPEYRTKCSEWGKIPWRDSDYVEHMIKLSAISSTALWQTIEFRQAVLAGLLAPECQARIREILDSPECRKRISQAIIDLWQTPEHRDKMNKIMSSPEYRAKMLAYWQDPEFCNRMAIIHAQQPRCSSLQITLYSILDDLGVKYHREYPDKPADPECVIGPHPFDCVVPRAGRTTLLIECQGGYWHGKPKAIAHDKSKASYIANNLSDQYELKYLWEHEFACKDRVIETVKYWLGTTRLEAVDFCFDDIKIRLCPASDYKLLLSKYHYLPNAGRGGIAYGAYLGDELIAVCVFSPLVRQNMEKSLGHSSSQARELSRLCIHPKYQKKNLASWFVSRCMKLLPDNIKLVVSYCDTTFNHDGATYKACNFTQDHVVKPDYWYIAEDGWVMHKRALYRHAVRLGMIESEYAAINGYHKIYGKDKLRFVFNR